MTNAAQNSLSPSATCAPEGLLAATEPRDMSPEELDAWLPDDKEGATPLFCEPAGSSDPLPGPRHVGVRTRLAILCLCAGIGDITRLTHIARPGAITAIEGIPPLCFDAVHRLIQEVIVDLARSLSGGAKAGTPNDVPKARILTPRISDGAVSLTEMARLDTHFAESLEGETPLIVLLPAGSLPSKSILAAAPLRIALAPLTRAVLLQYWAATHPTRVKVSSRAIVARLPSDELLSEVTDIVLLAALRPRRRRRRS